MTEEENKLRLSRCIDELNQWLLNRRFLRLNRKDIFDKEVVFGSKYYFEYLPKNCDIHIFTGNIFKQRFFKKDISKYDDGDLTIFLIEHIGEILRKYEIEYVRIGTTHFGKWDEETNSYKIELQNR